MTPDRNERIQEIFTNALERAEGAARDAYLAEACGPDAELRALVEALLRAHRNSMGFMRTLEVEPSDGGEGPGTVIGRYKLLQRIGEGGFGVVYMAEQQEPVRRKVALKIIKLGMDTREVIARFEAERQALALMDHPSIAQVFDGGITERAAHEPEGGARHSVRAESPSSESGAQGTDAPYPLPSVVSAGRPYFVMELVKGIPLTEYCDQEHLPATERLHLFIQVCHAVQHAHQKGVIHRDLKPSNILVTLHDGKPVPKIIDFGIAKAIGQPLTDKTLFTRFEQMIGTPAYMSPEQAALSGLDVDTRSDIYSLGVLLYELLTGTTPVQRETLHQVALDEIRRMIRETEPPKPSTRLYALVAADVRRLKSPGGRPPTEEEIRASSRRLLQIKEAVRLVRGDLDWIVMKALEKDRQRRYESAGVFAMDIERHLNHEPVTACPPSPVYRTRKFVRRHRVGVAMAAVVTVALLAGLTLALVGFAQARRERERAESEAAIAKAVNQFLQQDLLAQADPENEPDRDLKLRTVLDRAAAKIEGRFTNQPLVEAHLRHCLGTTYASLGESDVAEVHLRRALDLHTTLSGRDSTNALSVRYSLATLRLKQHRFAEAITELEALLEIHRKVDSPEHPKTLALRNGIALAWWGQGETAKAESAFREVADSYRKVLGSEHPETMTALNNLGLLLAQQGQRQEAAQFLSKTLEILRQVQGPEHPSTLNSMQNLAETLLQEEESLAKPLALFRELYPTSKKVFGPNHSRTTFCLENLFVLSGKAADWPTVLQAGRDLTSLHTDHWKDPYVGAVAAAMVSDREAYRGFCFALLDRYGNTKDPLVQLCIAETCLLVPDAVPDLQPVFHLADLGKSSGLNTVRIPRVTGMAEYRRGRWLEATHALESELLARGRPEARLLRDAFLAMAQHQLGETVKAKASLARVNQNLDLLTRAGSLGESWHDVGRGLVARREAEILIYSREVSPPVDANFLDESAKRWEPVREQLRQGKWLAARREWPRSRDALRQAFNDPQFSWIVAERHDELLPIEAAVALLMAGDYEAHEEMCRGLFTFESGNPGGRPIPIRTKAWLVRPRDRSQQLTERVLTCLDQCGMVELAETDHWGWLNSGIVAYRKGNYPDAASRFQHALSSNNVACHGTAMLFLAMTEQQEGRLKQAGQHLGAAEWLLEEPLRTFKGAAWWDLCVCQLALEEARLLLGAPGGSGVKPATPVR